MPEIDAFQRLAGLLTEPMLLADAHGRVLESNAAARELCPGLLLTPVLDAILVPERGTGGPDTAAAFVADHAARWATSDTPVISVLTARGADGRRIRCRFRAMRAPWTDRDLALVRFEAFADAERRPWLDEAVTALAEEVTSLRRAEAARARAARAEFAAKTRHQQLYVLTASLASATSLREVAEVVRREVPLAVGARACVLGLDLDALVPLPGGGDRVRSASDPWVDLACDAAGILTRAFTCGAPARLGAPGPRPLAAYDAIAAAHDHIGLSLPLRGADRELLGVLALVLEEPAPDPDEAYLHVVALQVAQALFRAALYEREHRMAQRLQMSLLPNLPDLDGVRVAARYVPGSDHAAVGGDWYDLFALPGGLIGVAVGDVSGHGLTEATEMAQLRNALRAIALEVGGRPGEVIRRLDAFTCTYLPERTATACYLVYDERARTLRYANAGHMPPMLLDAEGGARLLPGTTPLLGLPLPRTDDHHEVIVAAGETLVLYTDGLVERRGETLDVGFARLRAAASGRHRLEPEELCRTLADIRSEGEEAPDDRALLVLRFTPGTGDVGAPVTEAADEGPAVDPHPPAPPAGTARPGPLPAQQGRGRCEAVDDGRPPGPGSAGTADAPGAASGHPWAAPRVRRRGERPAVPVLRGRAHARHGPAPRRPDERTRRR